LKPCTGLKEGDVGRETALMHALVARGGYSGFRVTEMIEREPKSKPPKKSLGLQTKPPKNPWTKN